jgi:hypothetical protein
MSGLSEMLMKILKEKREDVARSYNDNLPLGQLRWSASALIPTFVLTKIINSRAMTIKGLEDCGLRSQFCLLFIHTITQFIEAMLHDWNMT